MSGFAGHGTGSSVAFILVLFILLVIILRTIVI
ncbi:sporulation protein YjcZ [Gorillibacterium massiliense]|nr:sporulation protein YjcZ [Gorillibacterium massiliense]